VTVRSVIHDTFVIERTYPAAPSQVFAAFASEEAKNWGDTGDLEPAEEQQAGPTEFDFRVGGRERFSHKREDTTYRYDATYYDIVPDQRLVYTYEMYADDVRMSGVTGDHRVHQKRRRHHADLDRARHLPRRHRRTRGSRAAQWWHSPDARPAHRLRGAAGPSRRPGLSPLGRRRYRSPASPSQLNFAEAAVH